MRGNYIDFISAYCDHWCERCRFTDRCSAYAVDVATAMCGGDFEAGLELAVGVPPPTTERERKRREEFLELIASIPEPTPAELADYEREQEARENRIDELPVTTASRVALTLGRRWLADYAETVAKDADTRVADALEVARRDCFFVYVKLRRALRGRERASCHDAVDNAVVQNDSNGSAKVALISIARSIHAWEVLADATADADARQIADALRALKRETEAEFPRAWDFLRPGFDGPPAP